MSSALAETLRTARLARGLTQKQVARLLDPPINKSLIGHYENGLRRVPPHQLVQLARILHLRFVVELDAGERVAS
jgi:transcriptional regulator with XRE-family HTH domain